MLLANETAVVHGAAGKIGGAADAAVLAVSGRASAMTGAIVNLMCGSILD
jgi:hypothetical protein